MAVLCSFEKGKIRYLNSTLKTFTTCCDWVATDTIISENTAGMFFSFFSIRILSLKSIANNSFLASNAMCTPCPFWNLKWWLVQIQFRMFYRRFHFFYYYCYYYYQIVNKNANIEKNKERNKRKSLHEEGSERKKKTRLPLTMIWNVSFRRISMNCFLGNERSGKLVRLSMVGFYFPLLINNICGRRD